MPALFFFPRREPLRVTEVRPQSRVSPGEVQSFAVREPLAVAEASAEQAGGARSIGRTPRPAVFGCGITHLTYRSQ